MKQRVVAKDQDVDYDYALDHVYIKTPMELTSGSDFAMQDKRVVESSWPSIVPLSREERSVRTDGPTLGFRKGYFARLHAALPDP